MKKQITTNKVLEMTLMSRFTLFRKVKAGEFPAPVGKSKRGMEIYDEQSVKQWIKENCSFVQHRLLQRSASIELTSNELKKVRKAAKLLHCEIEPFIIDAAVWKARKILELSGNE